MHGTNTTKYGTLLIKYYSFHSASCFYDVIQTCNLWTCKDYGILLKNITLMFRHVILVINDGTSFRSGEIPLPIARECPVIRPPAKYHSTQEGLYYYMVSITPFSFSHHKGPFLKLGHIYVSKNFQRFRCPNVSM